MRVDSGYKIGGDGPSLYYEIYENGFDIFSGESSTVPMLHQPEPYIPNPDISYEENAIAMCKQLGRETKKPFVFTDEMYTEMNANIDYLLLLSEV